MTDLLTPEDRENLGLLKRIEALCNERDELKAVVEKLRHALQAIVDETSDAARADLGTIFRYDGETNVSPCNPYAPRRPDVLNGFPQLEAARAALQAAEAAREGAQKV